MSALFDKIKRAEFAYPAHFSDGVKVLIDSLLVADPQKRATLTDVQKDRWFLDQTLSSAAATEQVQPLMRKKSSLKTSKSTRVQSLTSTSSPTQVVDALSVRMASGATLAEDQAPKPEETEDETDDEGPGSRSVEASLQSPSGLLALVATARPADNGSALDLLRGKGDILAFQAWFQGVLEAVRAAGVALTGPPEPRVLLFYRRRSLGKWAFNLGGGVLVAVGCYGRGPLGGPSSARRPFARRCWRDAARRRRDPARSDPGRVSSAPAAVS